MRPSMFWNCSQWLCEKPRKILDVKDELFSMKVQQKKKNGVFEIFWKYMENIKREKKKVSEKKTNWQPFF